MRRPKIRPCTRCGKPTRPMGVKIADAPGTIARATADLCSTCYGRDYERTAAKPRVSPRESPRLSGTCPRCGIHRAIGSNSAVICRDCRDVLTVEERRLWVA